MKILIACEFSGRVREAFHKKGHDVLSCDLLPSDLPGPHHQGDVRDIINNENWDMMIAHPPCTFLANSGVRWLYNGNEINQERWNEMEKAANFFKELLNAPIDKICIENPIQHKHAKKIIKQSYTQIVQPWQHGHGETKATCLWLKNLDNLQPSEIVNGREGRIHKLPPTDDRWKLRSVTYQGIANAMAQQWG